MGWDIDSATTETSPLRVVVMQGEVASEAEAEADLEAQDSKCNQEHAMIASLLDLGLCFSVRVRLARSTL